MSRAMEASVSNRQVRVGGRTICAKREHPDAPFGTREDDAPGRWIILGFFNWAIPKNVLVYSVLVVDHFFLCETAVNRTKVSK